MRSKKKVLPAIALRGTNIMPGMITNFDIEREESICAVETAMLKDQMIFLVMQREAQTLKPSIEDLYTMGVVATIKQVIKLPKGVVRVLVEATGRASILEQTEETAYLKFSVKLMPDKESALLPVQIEAMKLTLQTQIAEYAKHNPRISKSLEEQIKKIDTIGELVDHIAINIPMNAANRQILLETVEESERFEELTRILGNSLQVMSIQKEIQQQLKDRVEKNQKEYILREQLQFIKEALGEDHSLSDADDYAQQMEKLKAPAFVKEKLEKEISRFRQISTNSSESAVVRGYIETILEMPWNKLSKDNKSLKNAEEILNADHYGMEKVKDRMIEFLAVRNLTKKGESPIICLVGPPGTGKTSIAKSVARSLNKKYVRISLGGVRDEAEIRGHRKTYVGAMPGRIAMGLKNAGVKNPLILLDEIDKLSKDYKGDTASALLEVLDSEQNKSFRDHYIEIPIDLSEVLFIATANSLSDIPRPLLDRMEIVEVTSYTENEKMHIAKEHLIRKQMSRNGLSDEMLLIEDSAIEHIARNYTKEAGVRQLERKIGEICRKAAREICKEDGSKSDHQVLVTEANLEKYLGTERYHYDMANERDEVGIVRGLAWTSVGGDTLQIEVNIMPGKGEILLTGQLGDVMKESAKIGMSYIRSISSEYKIAQDYFKKHDFHIHIPQGSVPKDGPSAGITMATALFSAITKKPVRADVAMTGEITLRGRVLPIGGLKEKVLAAKNANIKKVLVPKKNERDINEISDEIKEGISIVYIETMKEVLEEAL